MIPGNLFHGALSAENGYLCRLPEGVRSFYHRLGSSFAARADCTAGIRISMCTDQRELYFRAKVISFCRSCNVVDVYENGVQVGNVRLPDMQPEVQFCFSRKSNALARIDLYLPNLCGLQITDCDFGDYNVIPSEKRKLLILGDSILQGICTYHPTNALAQRLSVLWNAETVNQCVGGAGFFPETLQPLNFLPDRILVALGANDAFSWQSDWQQRICDYASRLRELWPDTPVAAITPIWTEKMEGNPLLESRFRDVQAMIVQQGVLHHIHVIDGNDMVPHTSRFFNEDGIHPNDMGNLRYALNICSKLNWDHWNEV